jgi:hypothetical protein
MNIERNLFDTSLNVSFVNVISNKIETITADSKEKAKKTIYNLQTRYINEYLNGLTEQRRKAHDLFMTTKKLALFNLIEILMKEQVFSFDKERTIVIINNLQKLTDNKTSLNKLNNILNWLNKS